MILMDLNTEPRPTPSPPPQLHLHEIEPDGLQLVWEHLGKGFSRSIYKMRKQGKQMWATLAHILACVQARFRIYFGSASAMSRAPQSVIRKTKPNTAMNEN